jgi:hypothetical protein
MTIPLACQGDTETALPKPIKAMALVNGGFVDRTQVLDSEKSYSVIEIKPCWIAVVAASVRSDTWSFSMMLVT